VILLDTSICIHVITARPQPVLERFRQHRVGEIRVCSVVAAELAYGVAKSGSTRNRQALEMFLAPLVILPFDEVAVWVYGDLLAELEGKGTPIGSLDTMIAAHALRCALSRSACVPLSLRRSGGADPGRDNAGHRRCGPNQRG
jgi:tRNA(fMet)-specific endonuclease VapC